MKKKYLIIITAIVLMLSLIGCGKKEVKDDSIKPAAVEVKNEDKDKINESRLDGLKEAYKKAGFKVEDNETVAFEMVGANNGYKFKVDGELIEIYEYDTKNLNEDGKKYMEQAAKGSIDISGFNVPVKFKDGLMLLRFGEHSKKDKIVEVFNNYK